VAKEYDGARKARVEAGEYGEGSGINLLLAVVVLVLVVVEQM
jgi:hypothetical protein